MAFRSNDHHNQSVGSRAVVMLSAGQGGIIRLGTNWEDSCLFTTGIRNLLLQNATRSTDASRALAATTPLEANIQGGDPG